MIGECMNYIGFIVVSNTLGIDTNHELGNPEKKQMMSRDDMSGVECDFRGAPMIAATCRIGECDYQWLSTICVIKPQTQKGVPLGCGNFR